MEQTITIQPIINGSANPRLTPKLFAELDKQTQAQVIWNLKVGGEFAHTFRDIDHEVFEKLPTSAHEDHPDPVENFKKVRKALQDHHNRMRVKTSNRRYELGKRIYQAQRELGFGGMIQLDADRLQGFVKEGGNWNDFNTVKVNAGIARIEAEAPRQDYGPNNPNTGYPIHKWKISPNAEYIVLEYDFINLETAARVKDFFRNYFEPYGRSMKADSIRIEEQDLGNGYFSAELVLWWD